MTREEIAELIERYSKQWVGRKVLVTEQFCVRTSRGHHVYHAQIESVLQGSYKDVVSLQLELGLQEDETWWGETIDLPKECKKTLSLEGTMMIRNFAKGNWVDNLEIDGNDIRKFAFRFEK